MAVISGIYGGQMIPTKIEKWINEEIKKYKDFVDYVYINPVNNNLRVNFKTLDILLPKENEYKNKQEFLYLFRKNLGRVIPILEYFFKNTTDKINKEIKEYEKNENK